MKKTIKLLTALLSSLTLIFAVSTIGNTLNEPFATNASIIQIAAKSKNENDKKMLIPGGESFGVKLYTDGVLVVELSEFESENGKVCPAKDAGVKIKDVIVSVNGSKVSSNEEIGKIISDCEGNSITLKIKRNNEIIDLSLMPEKCISQQTYKSGMWVRDSTAGIGTITYYDPETMHLGGLGHGISDTSTGVLMPAASGEIIGAEITSVIPGQKGVPGQLQGVFDKKTVFGKLLNNSDKGIFAEIDSKYTCIGDALPIATNKEIHTGDAYIMCTVSENEKQCYAVVIESLSPLAGEGKNLIIKITDQDLLDITGGIVQGMSGSPIIQDGKIIGAVTHVFVNDPTRGYGVFIENMLANDV